MTNFEIQVLILRRLDDTSSMTQVRIGNTPKRRAELCQHLRMGDEFLKS